MDVERKQRDMAKWSLDEDFRFDDIYNFITYEDWLRQAFLTVKNNAGWKTAGVDGETVPDFAEDLGSNIQALSQQLGSETYDPDPTRRVYIPKGNGEKRPLSIPTVRDRIVQEALRMLLEPIYESDFSTHSFGFRPGRSTHDAIGVVQRCFTRNGAYKPWVIDADIKGFFDNVCHRTLEQILQGRITQKKVRDLIWRFLKAGVMESGRQMESLAGTPQGGILSPLLANIYLNELDHAVGSFVEETPRGKGHWTYVRYADDFLLLTSGPEQEAKEKKRWVDDYVGDALNLSLNKEKTQIVHAEDGGVGFLGYRIEPAHPTDGGGSYTRVPREAVQDVKAAINRRCGQDAPTDLSTRRRIRGVNAALRGWAEYYKYATHTNGPFAEVDRCAWHKLSTWMARKYRCSRKALFRRKGVSPSPLGAKGKQMVDIKSRGDAKWREPKEKPHPYFDGTAKRTEPTATYRFYENEHSLNHRDLRWEVFQRDDFTCQECGREVGWYSDGELHHLEYSGDPVDAETLCASCHAKKDSHRHL
ncbi:group II intron reverse transcriptase/maturase [Salinibacter altiplanensis]|uniref:group II intron reverse transcriptase/maturase n=1 Tax=Salinibacter altiplanensis TaxID=1803181 RepID=UPI000C9F538A|nr:group II intron reverse transcriptase/maturase [Salinibacter altiplanensis]